MADKLSGVTYYKLVSEYSGDVTKNCSLTSTELDNNFNYLRGNNIKALKWLENNELVLVKDNGDEISAGDLRDFAISAITNIVSGVTESLKEQEILIDELANSIGSVYNQFDESLKAVSAKTEENTTNIDTLLEKLKITGDDVE